MTRDDGTIQIRSYRNCFKLERRIHKIDHWRIPLPFGIPLRGLGYAVATALAMLVLGSVPLLGLALTPVTPVVRFVVVPGALAYVLTRWELDGRPAHATLRSWVLMEHGHGDWSRGVPSHRPARSRSLRLRSRLTSGARVCGRQPSTAPPGC